jgi:hypothetical protein
VCTSGFSLSSVAITQHNVIAIDAVVLTHGHCDAILGYSELRSLLTCSLDDLREMSNGAPIPLFLDKETFEAVNRTFPHLIDPAKVYLLLNYLRIGH